MVCTRFLITDLAQGSWNPKTNACKGQSPPRLIYWVLLHISGGRKPPEEGWVAACRHQMILCHSQSVPPLAAHVPLPAAAASLRCFEQRYTARPGMAAGSPSSCARASVPWPMLHTSHNYLSSSMLALLQGHQMPGLTSLRGASFSLPVPCSA